MPATLYYTPTSCGAASFVSAFKAGLIQSGKVVAYEADIRSHTIVNGPNAGKSFYDVNPKGNVPALVLEDGTLLNEGAACLQGIADQAPEAGLAPAYGTTDRYVLMNILNFLASEVHGGGYGPLFYAPSEEARVPLREKLAKKLAMCEGLLDGGKKEYLVGGGFTVADAYLAIILSWSPYVGVDLTPFPGLAAYKDKCFGLDFWKEAAAAMAAATKA